MDSIERAFVLKEAIDDFVGCAIREERQKQTLAGRGVHTNSDARFVAREESAGRGSEPGVSDAKNRELISTDELTLDDWKDLKLILGILELFRR